MCEATANTYGIDFVRFKLRDILGDKTLFEVAKPENKEGRLVDAEMCIFLLCSVDTMDLLFNPNIVNLWLVLYWVER